jgi:hypothetical protein
MLNQLIDKRTEVEGARVWFGKTALEPLPVLDPHKLTKSTRNRLLELFNQLTQIRFPSILEQLETRFEGRIMIDRELAKLLEIGDYHEPASLAKLYESTAMKLKSLKSMMGRR